MRFDDFLDRLHPDDRQSTESALNAHFADAALLAYGHVADGNLHFSIAPGAAPDFDAVNRIVYRPLQKLRGSVSAEHGIGLEKKPYLHLTRNAEEIELMRRIKRMMDPKNLLNPGKVFDMNPDSTRDPGGGSP